MRDVIHLDVKDEIISHADNCKKCGGSPCFRKVKTKKRVLLSKKIKTTHICTNCGLETTVIK